MQLENERMKDTVIENHWGLIWRVEPALKKKWWMGGSETKCKAQETKYYQNKTGCEQYLMQQQ